jgi:ubiquinone/menaquinone biosynthesis C-methylase UbiE
MTDPPRLCDSRFMSDKTSEMRRAIANDWLVPPYYEQAENWLDPFWGEETPFRRWFETLDLTRVIELACGRGRHAAQCLDRVGEITLVDVLQTNIDGCRERFGTDPRVHYLVNNGNDLPGLESGAYSALFSYDAMLHFELLDVLDYLRETARVLRPGGRALLHVSNNLENPGGHYHQNRLWRNFGSLDVVRHVADRLGLRTLEHTTLDWEGQKAIDGLLLVEKGQ